MRAGRRTIGSSSYEFHNWFAILLEPFAPTDIGAKVFSNRRYPGNGSSELAETQHEFAYIADNKTIEDYLPMQKIALRADPVLMLVFDGSAVPRDSLETRKYFAPVAFMVRDLSDTAMSQACLGSALTEEPVAK